MSENLIPPPLLFSNDFPGYRELQYLLYFFVFLVITLLFTCKKSKFSRPGLQMNSHANFTYSYPQLKIIFIPTMIWSILFSFFTLIACTGSPIPRILLVCDIDLLHIFLSSWNTSSHGVRAYTWILSKYLSVRACVFPHGITVGSANICIFLKFN